MTSRILIVLILRVLTIYMVVIALNQFAMMLPVFASMPHIWFWMILLSPLGIILVGTLLWCITYRLADFATKNADVTIGTITLTKADLYCFAFVFTGISTVLAAVGSAGENGYKFFIYDLNKPLGAERIFLVRFVCDVLRLMIGFACVYGARKWTDKIIRWENKRETPPAA